MSTAPLRDVAMALDHVLRLLSSDRLGLSEVRSLADIHAVGHRIVHGGEMFKESVLIDDKVLKGIEECIDLAPLHNPSNIRGIRAAREIFGARMPQVAVFDTAFHASIPEHAYLYAVPYHLYRRHRIRRYGFHGTSHRYVAYRYRMLNQLTREQTNVITVHLGNGCSAAAIRAGHSIDTSMGMTPLEGLVMGTRSGDLDPSIVNLIATKEGMQPPEVEGLLNTQSGLLGISGLTNDMRVLQEELRLTTTAASIWRLKSSAIGRANTSARSSHRWAAPTPSSSPAASARTPLKFERRSAAEWSGPVWFSTRKRIERPSAPRAASRRPIPSSQRTRSRPTKSS